MKVVLFCGGQSMRLREVAPHTPKPLVRVGPHPLLLNLMRYYAHHGHRDFVLCLGHQAEEFRQYFQRGQGQRAVAAGWRIDCVDTGLHVTLGERLQAVRAYLDGESEFLVNYADVLSDLPLPEMLAAFRQRGLVASFLAYRPSQSFHVVAFGDDDQVRSIEPLASAGLWVNAGFMVFTSDIFNYLRPGEELVEQPFQRLLAEGQLMAYRYQGFWATMDTPKDKQVLDQLYAQGCPPWEVWRDDAQLADASADAPARGGLSWAQSLLARFRRPSLHLA